MTGNPFDEFLKPPPPPADAYRFAEVTATGPLRIKLDGDTAPLESTPTALCTPVTGDRVWVQLHGLQLIVLGIVAAS